MKRADGGGIEYRPGVWPDLTTFRIGASDTLPTFRKCWAQGDLANARLLRFEDSASINGVT